MSTTSIEWTEQTWNPVAGCSLVSPGCTNCYAMRMAARLEAMGQEKYVGTTKKVNGRAVWTGKIVLDDDALKIPIKREKPTMWFVNSMSDLFHENVPFEFIDRVFAVMALTPQHTYQVLTKRPERMAAYTAHARQRIQDAAVIDQMFVEKVVCVGEMAWPLPNVWLGCSPVNQKTYEEYRPHILHVPAAVRFYSLEPLLGPIDLGELSGIHWVIVGGESGPGARPFDVLWAESIIEQCRAAGVACFLKQLGSRPMLGDSSSPHGWPTESGPVNWETGDIRLKDKKGGDIAEFAEDLRVREFPV